MDRLSDYRFLANFFRLYLHAAALNLLTRLRREIADPPAAPRPEVPVAALPEPERKRYSNARRRQDPLGEGQPATWRLLLIKVAASVVVSCRRIVIRLSGSWPHQEFSRGFGSTCVVGRRCPISGADESILISIRRVGVGGVPPLARKPRFEFGIVTRRTC